MKRNIIIKCLIVTAWLLVAVGMIVLLAAANREQKQHICRRVVVRVKGDGEKMFIEKTDVLHQLKTAAKGSLINKPISKIDLANLEKALEKHSWIRDAELYFDSRDLLHVSVSEREPIARIFTTAGASFYIDSSGKRMPLLDRVRVRVPVVTNFTAAKHFTAKDSLQLSGVKSIARFISTHEFWNAQIAQIDITPSGTFELVPVIGNHIIRLGNADNVAEKFDRLFVFYKQVLSKTGFDKYPVVDVQFAGQVIGLKDRFASKVDSIQLQKNIEALMERSRQMVMQDSLAVVEQFNAQVSRDSAIQQLMLSLEEKAKEEKRILDSVELLRPLGSRENANQNLPLVKPILKPKTNSAKNNVLSKPNNQLKPKAVMKKKVPPRPKEM